LATAVAAAALVLAGAPPLDSPLRAQPPKGKQKATPKAAPKKPAKKQTVPHVFKVQARSPQWRVTPAANKAAAQVAARTLKRQGGKAQVKVRAGRAYVRAKMTRWRTRAVVTNRPAANRVASVLRAQRFQARVVQVK